MQLNTMGNHVRKVHSVDKSREETQPRQHTKTEKLKLHLISKCGLPAKNVSEALPQSSCSFHFVSSLALSTY